MRPTVVRCRLQGLLTWCSSLLDTVCPRHAPCRTACHHQQPPWWQPSSSHCRLPMAIFQLISRGAAETPNPLRRHSQPSPTPSQPSTQVHIGHHNHDGSSARAGQTLGSGSRWSTALGWGTYGGRVVGQDGQELLRTLRRQVRRPVLLSLDGGSNTRHSTPLHGSTARRRDTLECTCCSEGGSALRVRV
jgi:hypothetical protein